MQGILESLRCGACAHRANGPAAAGNLARAGLCVEQYEARRYRRRVAQQPLFDGDVVHGIYAAVHRLAAASEFFRGIGLLKVTGHAHQWQLSLLSPGTRGW
ncbi:hypothetical protein HEK616_47770 [Streptomyces nigrescens]|uniref:Uncharacterized protein n=1 Tax=Streptomyces nigrescens TaxID=1920 RepID=A0ABM7ZY33_STRNI|nr:hypothetical protein HEK616_47770 [Streptomyces nigrescens]